MNVIKNNVLKIVIATIAIIGLSSWYFLVMESDQISSSIELTEDLQSVTEQDATHSSYNLQKTDNSQAKDSAPTTTPTVISKLTLVAVVLANPAENSSAVIQFDLISDNYAIGESIKKTNVVLKEVLADYVTVTLDAKQYVLRLKGGEADTYSSPIDSIVNDSEIPMTAKEIGNRPKQLDHIISISPENNDYSPEPGINPALFKAAKFKPGDILQSINGKDVTIPEELAAANALIATAQTLEFVVLRGGRTVTLYLDIPSKNLSISFD